MIDIGELLQAVVAKGASDLHLTSLTPPAIRVRGEIERLDWPPLEADELRFLIRDMLNEEQSSRFEEHHDLDMALELKGIGRFRVNVFINRDGPGAVFRTIPTRIPTFEELGLPETLIALARKERGLVLVTGPTGSGKSTTLAAILDLINRERKGHILTLEDPIEFVHPHKNCIVNQREIGPHTHSFTTALRAALREDPDFILVGEMRDLETISLAVSAAETGHLVFGTLHTSSAAQTVDRIIDVFPPHQQSQIRVQLSESLQAVVAQMLLPKLGGGRVAALEILTVTGAVKNLIREGKTFQLPSIIQTSTKDGMQSLEQALRDLILQGKIRMEDAAGKGVDMNLVMAASGGQAGPNANSNANSNANNRDDFSGFGPILTPRR
ncbi:MAG TPA: type IV pilus twitching motility protein PilT [Armatimonadota bacterium]|nr:type IV pilus twitching motility protein PilT [Armatimonadota bacterium]